jgi:hypothetical protein
MASVDRRIGKSDFGMASPDRRIGKNVFRMHNSVATNQ